MIVIMSYLREEIFKDIHLKIQFQFVMFFTVLLPRWRRDREESKSGKIGSKQEEMKIEKSFFM